MREKEKNGTGLKQTIYNLICDGHGLCVYNAINLPSALWSPIGNDLLCHRQWSAVKVINYKNYYKNISCFFIYFYVLRIQIVNDLLFFFSHISNLCVIISNDNKDITKTVIDNIKKRETKNDQTLNIYTRHDQDLQFAEVTCNFIHDIYFAEIYRFGTEKALKSLIDLNLWKKKNVIFS